MRVVPTYTDPFAIVNTQLDGSTYQFYFQYNHRTSTWTFDLYDNNGNPVTQGVKIVPDTALLGRCHYESNCPPGELLCCALDPTNDSPPGLLDLDLSTATAGRCRLYYLPLLDLIQIAGATGPISLGDNG
jgi:hypothetical protein